MSRPELTVVVTSYNYSRFIARCISSILQQDFSDFELFILDNNSKDDTESKVADFLHDPRVVFVRRSENIGGFLNFNFAFREGVGRYLSIVSADDFLLPGHFSKLLRGLRDNPSCVLAYTPIQIVDDDDVAQGVQRHPGYALNSYSAGRNDFCSLLAYDCYVTLVSVIFDRAQVATDLYFDLDVWSGSDWDLFIRLAEKYKNFWFDSEATACYRVHAGQYSQQNFYSTLDPLYSHLSLLERNVFSLSVAELECYGEAILRCLKLRLSGYSEAAYAHLTSRLTRVFAYIEEGRLPLSKGNSLFIIYVDRDFSGLLGTLTSVVSQKLSGWDIEVVGEGGSDWLVANESLLSGLDIASVSFLDVAHERSIIAINESVNSCAGDFVAFIYSGSELATHFLDDVTEEFQLNDVEVVFDELISSYLPVSGVLSANFGAGYGNIRGGHIYRREVFNKISGYSPIMLAGGVDWDFALRVARAGYKFSFVRLLNTKASDPAAQKYYSSDNAGLIMAQLVYMNSIYFKHVEIFTAFSLLMNYKNVWQDFILRILELSPTCSSAHFMKLLLPVEQVNSGRPSHPLFSIIITTYNRPDLLRYAIGSVQKQRLQDFELILVNDAGAPVEAMLSEFSIPISYIRQGVNQGPSAARNAGLRQAIGRHICFLDDDDLFAPDHLQFLAESLPSHPQKAVLYTDAWYVGETLEAGERVVNSREIPYDQEIFSPERLSVANYIPVNTWCVPRALFAEVGEFDTSLPALEDWEMLLRFSRCAPLVHLPRATVEVRVRQSVQRSLSQHQRSNFPMLFRNIYSRYKVKNVKVEQARLKMLAGLDAEFSEGTSGGLDMPEIHSSLKVGVVLYVYYPELWGEFSAALSDLYANADFFITTVPARAVEVKKLLERDFPRAKLFVFENRGRDLGQLFSLMQSVDLGQYDYVLKLHTKKSMHLADGKGDAWRKHVLDNILPVGRLDEIFSYFDENPDVGLLGPRGLLFSVKNFAGVNYNEIVRWAGTLDFDFDLDLIDYEFVVGTMFWIRGAVFKKLRSIGIKKQDFESELGQVDGTLAHVMECVIPLAAKVIDLRTVPLLLPSRKVAASSGVVSQWKTSRKITGSSKRYIEDYFNDRIDSPVLAVFVLDFVGGVLQLIDTVQSLSRYNFIYPAIKIFVFSDSIVELADAPDNLVFVTVDLSDYAGVLNSLVEQGGFDWLMLVSAGEEFTKNGVARAAQEIISNPDCRALYGDEFLRLSDGSLGSAFRPSFNFDLLLSFPQAMAHHWLFNREAFLTVGGFDSAYKDALELDLLLRLVEHGGLSGFGHVDEPLIVVDAPQLVDNFCEKQTILRHLNVRGYQADILTHLPGRYRIAYNHQAQPLVSIIVPTKDQLPMLQRCIESLLEKTRYAHYELLIVDNNSETLEAREWLAAVEQMDEAKVRVLRYPHPFNYSAINNMAAREARGEYLVLLNNDTAIISESWLDELLNHAQRPEVGIVGAKLLYPDGRIQHAGVILGLRGPAEHPFIGDAMDAPGFMNRLQVDQNYSAVTAACLMIRKSIYEEVGGLDEESFKVSYNDVDLCLKVGDLGYLTVWTPHAVVMHEGSVSQKQVDPASLEAKRKRFLAEQDAMYAKWLPKLANDPAYNANLALNGPGFTLETNTDLTWRPLAWRPLPVVLAHNADPWGCGNYRIIKPHRAMRDEGLIDGAVADRLLEPAELLRLSPDVVVYQRQTKPESLESMERSRRFSAAFKVYELDDYLPNTPIKSAHRSMLSKDLVKLLRKGLGYVDRFVVSTPALANALSSFHSDIRIVENRLPLDWWGELLLSSNSSTKPRVGWAGGIGHQGDLELIADVVRDLADEVDWVFFGMCPDKLRPYVAEYIPGIDIQLYPGKLASLQLDLALAPLEDNLFNTCKSNLRLLEYGICGYPVIASDIECYRGGLPVTLVKNRYRDWVEAIRSQLVDRQALAARGLELRAAIQRDWMLTGACLEAWRDAWLPG